MGHRNAIPRTSPMVFAALLMFSVSAASAQSTPNKTILKFNGPLGVIGNKPGDLDTLRAETLDAPPGTKPEVSLLYIFFDDSSGKYLAGFGNVAGNSLQGNGITNLALEVDTSNVPGFTNLVCEDKFLEICSPGVGGPISITWVRTRFAFSAKTAGNGSASEGPPFAFSWSQSGIQEFTGASFQGTIFGKTFPAADAYIGVNHLTQIME